MTDSPSRQSGSPPERAIVIDGGGNRYRVVGVHCTYGLVRLDDNDQPIIGSAMTCDDRTLRSLKVEIQRG